MATNPDFQLTPSRGHAALSSREVRRRLADKVRKRLGESNHDHEAECPLGLDKAFVRSSLRFE